MMVMALPDNWYSFTWLIAGNLKMALLARKRSERRGGLCITKIGF